VDIRDATPRDWPRIWPVFGEVVQAGETYAYDPDLSSAQARRLWLMSPPSRTVVGAIQFNAVVETHSAAVAL